MDRAPEVSVITPTKNRLKLLCATMESVRRQTLGGWEHIVVDDGSDDGTAGEVRARARADARVRYLHREGGKAGASACRNIGIAESRAGLVVFLDSDDLLAADCLERRVDLMRRNADLDFAVFDGDVFHERVGDLGRRFDMGHRCNDLDRLLALDFPWDTTGPIWRKETLLRLGGWDEDMMSFQDVDLHIRALASAARYVREHAVDHHILWKANQSRISDTRGFDTRVFATWEPCPIKWREALARGGALSQARDEALAGIVFFIAEHWASNRNLARAWKVWGMAGMCGLARAHVLIGRAFLAAHATPLAANRLLRGLLRRWKILARIMPPTERRPSARRDSS